jgi:predicted glycoside hydrolase/deacetylase ChbG (UPF0249 family)
MTHKRTLIVNADDFGYSPGINRGIITAHEQGIVTSASLMVRWPRADEAAAYGKQHPELSVGLHVDLGEWTYRDGAWVPVYQAVSLDDVSAVAAEVSRQLVAFRRLLGRDPTHLDSHQHAHRRASVGALLIETARQLSLPLRGCTPAIYYCGGFYSQNAEGAPRPGAVSADSLLEILAALPRGIVELSCHPGDGDEDVNTVYRRERALEVKVLCDPGVRAAVVAMGFELCSFGDVPWRAGGLPTGGTDPRWSSVG